MPDPASPPTSPQYVPYQAYKVRSALDKWNSSLLIQQQPKRHSRNFSGTSASGSRPSSAVISPAASPRPRVQPDDDKEPMPTLSLVGSYGHSPSPSPIGRYMDSRAGTPTIRVQKVDTQPPDHATPDSSTSLPTSTNGNQLATAADTTPRSSTAVEFPHSTPSPSSSVPPSPSTLSHPHSAPMQQLSPAPRKISTFKRLTPRPSAPSSPLAGAPRQIHTTHSRSVSAASLQAVGKASDPPQSLASPANGQASNGSKTSTPNVLTTSPRPVEKSLPMTPRTSTAPLEEIRRSQSQASSLSKSISQSSSPYPEVNRSLTSSPYQKPKSAPYRPGFQPKGVYRPLTDEFLAIRRLKRDGEGDTGRLKRIEREKLERRFEKLVNLHFPAPGSDAEKIQHLKSEAPDVKPLNRRASSFFDFESIRSRKFSDAGDLWRGVVSGSQDKSRDIRGQHPSIRSRLG
ncbi:hypothetical protein NMY22_g4000 [Coprinellus aureogranulatus]|nr:hypothetical protein NMY22_g4000 [Coprinellus aureogranulatus]